jgi:glycosyltransferase involved in cell wall biosynthesis
MTRGLSDSVKELSTRLAELTRAIDKADEFATHKSSQLSDLRDEHARLSYRLADVAVVSERAQARAEESDQVARAGVRNLRIELDDISRRTPRGEGELFIEASVSRPTLSIAVPAFNRPSELRSCLESIVREVETGEFADVEVWITDDVSTVDEAVEVAREFAAKYWFVGFRQNVKNLGLEHNLIECCVPCSGDYLWIVGNDDIIHEGGLKAVLSDARESHHSVLLYDKVRIDHSGTRVLNPTPGCIPTDVSVGERRTYGTLLDFAGHTGVLSGFGFISTLVIKRAQYLSSSADPYLGLTMYPQVGLLLETCGDDEMLFHNTPVVYHRTTTRQEKLGEALGRREEGFMAGGIERDPRWFGDTLAALLQRVVDRSNLSALDFAEVPELLFRQDSLIGYIGRNRGLRLEAGLELPDDVLDDARRFMAVFERADEK